MSDREQDRALVERLRAHPKGRIDALDIERLLALAERGIAERADVVAFLRDPLWIATARRALAVAADDIERGAHVGAAGVGKPEGGA